MYCTTKNIVVALLMMLSAACSNSIPFELSSVVGWYRLKYYPEIDNQTGWDYDLIQLEELMKINSDSTYTIERIHPAGGFEILPDSGTWSIKDNHLLLHSKHSDGDRSFQAVENGIIEPECSRKDLRNIVWKRE